MQSPEIAISSDDFFASSKIDLPTVEKALAAIERGKVQDWSSEKSPSRSTINYGWDFVSLERGLWQFLDIPLAIVELRAKVYEIFSKHITEGDTPDAFDNIIVTIYGPGEAIVPHIDRDGQHEGGKKHNYRFGESILGVVLQVDAIGKLRFIKHEGVGRPAIDDHPVIEVNEERGTAFLFQGALRHYPYFHGVSRVAERRVSVTFRATKLH